ncbi:alpha-tocopherol transfer protein-like [Arctopsyche grandis]|uniref:alpha-tocopherol transfer protein-like n=1 Tax=Arctopsyche grandis TaxID=121162 RepID=UPI00406DA411
MYVISNRCKGHSLHVHIPKDRIISIELEFVFSTRSGRDSIMAMTSVTVEEEFKKNSQLSKDSLDSMRDWIEKQPHLPKLSDLDIVFFLHSCFYSMEKAKYTIETYYTVRTHVPEFFSNRDPNHSSLVRAMDFISFIILPETTIKGERVIYCKLYDMEPSHFIFADAMKYFCSVTDLMLQEYGTDLGHKIVIDMDGVVIGHLARLAIIPLKKILYYLQEAMPVRLSGMHFINAVSFMDKILALMRPFMKQELMEMIHIHTANEMKSFYEYVSKDIMLSEFGGRASDTLTLRKQTIDKMKKNKEFFLQEENLRVNEAKRPGKAKNAGDIFGVEGSFKKLDID